MALAKPLLAVRQEGFDFIVSELKQREDEQYPAIRKLRSALRNQRDSLPTVYAIAAARASGQKPEMTADGRMLIHIG